MALWGKTDETGSIPKFLSTADKAKAFYVDAVEAEQPEAKAKGITGPGWWLYSTYTDVNGSVRHKAECVVIFGNGVVPGTSGDRADDATLPDRTITISAQPQDDESATGSEVTFSVTASVSPTTTLGYLWQVSTDSGETWSSAAGTNNAATYTIADNTGLDGNQYRVRVSATGATTVTSTAATLTEAA